MKDEIESSSEENKNQRNFIKDCRPETLARNEIKKKQQAAAVHGATQSQGAFTNPLIVEKVQQKGAAKPAKTKQSQSRGGIIKTVVLPHEEVNRLTDETD